MCPFRLLSFICRYNKHHNVVPMLLSKSPSWSRSFQKGAEKEEEVLGRDKGWHARCNNTAGRRDESTTISAVPKQHASGRAKLFKVLQRDDGAFEEDYWNQGVRTGRSGLNGRWRCGQFVEGLSGREWGDAGRCLRRRREPRFVTSWKRFVRQEDL